MTGLRTGDLVVIVSLLLALLAAIGLAYEGTTLGGNFRMALEGYMALALGAAFCLSLGVGLMALVFYGSNELASVSARNQSAGVEENSSLLSLSLQRLRLH